jgi:hypothetical protein
MKKIINYKVVIINYISVEGASGKYPTENVRWIIIKVF